MAITLEELEIKFTAQYGGLQSQLNEVKNRLKGTEAAAASATRAMSGLGRIAKTFLTVYVGRALLRVGKSSLSMANEVVESENLFTESMRGMSAEARKWSDSVGKNLGLNPYSLRKNVGTFNVMFKSMGIGTDKAYEMATGLTQLAEDMASFYNLSSEEVFSKLQSGITGMSMPLKQLGILVDDNAVKQYAMAEGISKTGKEMTQQEKVMARYAAIMAQTSTAQGDMARTIESPANQLRVLNNTLNQAQIALGQAFQPIQTAVMPLLNALASAAMTAAQAIAFFVRSLTGFGTISVFASLAAGKSADAQKDLTKSLDGTSKSLKKAGGAAKQAAKDTKVGLKAFDEINKLTEEATNAGGGGGGGIDEVDVPDLDPLHDYTDALELVSEKVKAIAEAIRAFWDGLKNSLLGTMIGAGWEILKGIFNDFILPIGSWFLANPTLIGDAIGAIAIAIGTFKIVTGISRWLAGIGDAIRNIGNASVTYPGVAGFIHKIGTTIAAHPGVAVAAGIAAGIALIAQAIIRHENELRNADLASRFGRVSIAMSDLRIMAEQTRTPFVNAISRLKKEYEAIEQAASKIEQLAANSSTILFAYALSPEPMDEDKKEQVKNSVQGVIDSTIDALNEARAFSMKSVKMTFGDSEEGKKLIEIDEGNWATIEGEIKKISEQLDQAVAEYLLTDDPTPEQAAAATRYQDKLAALIREATNIDKAMAEVRLHKILVDFDGTPTLTSETITNFSSALNEELAKQAEEINLHVDTEMAIRINRARIAGELEGQSKEAIDAEVQAVKDHWETRRNVELESAKLSVGQVYFEGVSNQITNAYADEIAKSKAAVKVLNTDFTAEAAKSMFGPDDWKKEMRNPANAFVIATEAKNMFMKAMKGIGINNNEVQTAARKNIKDLLALMSPQISEWKTLYNDLKAGGKEIPAWLVKGLNDVQALEAVVKAGEAVEAAIETGLSPNPEDYHELGSEVIGSVIDGAESKKAEMEAAMSKLGSDAMNRLRSALQEGRITKDLYDQIISAAASGTLEQLARTLESGGDSAGAAFVRGILSKTGQSYNAGASLKANATSGTQGGANSAYSTGSSFGQGFVNGIESKVAAARAAAKRLANAASGTLKSTLSIKSPSKVTEWMGEMFSTGFENKILLGIPDVAEAATKLGNIAVKSLDASALNNGIDLSANTNMEISVATAFEDAVAQAVRGVTEGLQFNMVMDGETFGRASLKSINNAQRMAGRILLEM